jgi:hypothetical protein
VVHDLDLLSIHCYELLLGLTGVAQAAQLTHARTTVREDHHSLIERLHMVKEVTRYFGPAGFDFNNFGEIAMNERP